MGGGDTIFALASGHGRAGIAVIRMSGAAAYEALTALTDLGREILPRRAVLCTLRDPNEDDILDRCLTLWFPAPDSFTGEDVVELHLHGGLAVISGVFQALAALPGLRPAEPGEFSRRAFLNGKMDLTEAEGLADLVAAETAAQRRQALRQLSGGLGGIYQAWREKLIRIMAEVEAEIDFVDEEDVPEDLFAAVRGEVERLGAAIGAHLADSRRGERLREGLYIAILGPPNVGKSSLLNALARRDAAIVSEIAGTTRDVIEVHMDLGGYPAILADTAGLRATANAIEDEGVARALARAATADLKLLVLDASDIAGSAGEMADLVDDDTLVVVNKIDLTGAPRLVVGREPIAVSVLQGAGLGTLERAIEEALTARLDVSGGPSLTRARHRAALEATVAALQRAMVAEASELAAEDLRLAGRELGRITGRVDVEDILDVVFASFCIGK